MSKRAEPAAGGRRTLVEYGESQRVDLIKVRNALGRIKRRFAYRGQVMAMHKRAGGLVLRCRSGFATSASRLRRFGLCQSCQAGGS